jgi:uncharacterized damage-inducible protein DinB
MKRPGKQEYAPFYEPYIRMIPPRKSIRTLLKSGMDAAKKCFGHLSEDQGNMRYAPDKWTTKELLVHMIDTERVFAHRILWFMRGDRVALPGFHQDLWMEHVRVEHRTIKDLLREWKAVRDNTLFLLDQITEEQAVFQGTASNWTVTPRALFYIIVGHQLHHEQVFRTHYLPAMV